MITKKAALAAAIKGARAAAGFHTSTDFAKKLDVDPSTVSRWENTKDDKWPTMGHMNKAIGLLGPAGQESVLRAYFTGNSHLISVLGRKGEEPEIDDTSGDDEIQPRDQLQRARGPGEGLTAQ